MAENNPFDGPIPGQSLTDEPGSKNWEKPAKFNRPQEALDFIWDKITEEKQAIKLLALLEAGLPAQGIAETILFAGFTEGLWTPDVMLLIGKPVLTMVAAMGTRAGIKVKIGTNDKDELIDFLRDLKKGSKAKDEEKPLIPELPRPEEAAPPSGGLMSRGMI
jgi:hypothetical protein